jgi:hypothetical protein
MHLHENTTLQIDTIIKYFYMYPNLQKENLFKKQ